MSDHFHDIPVDSEGVPILTDIVAEDVLFEAETAPGLYARGLTTSELAAELLDSEVFQQQLDEIAAELTRSIRLQIEQTLGIAIENVINKALDDNNVRSFELIRHQLEDSLPVLLVKALQDEGVIT
jgi:precorrin-3B methylase